MHSSAASRLLELAKVAVSYTIIPTYISGFSAASHSAAGLYLLQALFQGYFDDSFISRQRETTGHFLQLATARIKLSVAATYRLLLRLSAVDGALGPVEFIETKRRGHFIHMLSTVLPHHLASIVIQLAVAPARYFADAETPVFAVLGGQAVTPVSYHNSLSTGFFL